MDDFVNIVLWLLSRKNNAALDFFSDGFLNLCSLIVNEHLLGEQELGLLRWLLHVNLIVSDRPYNFVHRTIVQVLYWCHFGNLQLHLLRKILHLDHSRNGINLL
jgi:hypothetical protein